MTLIHVFMINLIIQKGVNKPLGMEEDSFIILYIILYYDGGGELIYKASYVFQVKNSDEN